MTEHVSQPELNSTNDVPMQLPSYDIWDSKYRLRDRHGEPVDQTVEDTYKRVAKTLASIEHEEEREFWEERFLWALENGAIPAGRITSNAGASDHKTAVSLINCTVSKNVRDGMAEILSAVSDAGITLKAGCGIGYSFSTIRPRGAYVHGAGAGTNGPIAFMDIFDKMCFTVASAGGRRGAQMATFDVSHPDVEEFIDAKREDGRLRQFNMSLLITDEFMEAVKNRSEWPLVFPTKAAEFDDLSKDDIIYRDWPVIEDDYILDDQGRVACKVYQRINAGDLWKKIMRSTYDYAEPGFILIDAVNRMNNNWWCETITATNPCFTGDTRVWTDRGHIPFNQLVGTDINVLTQNHQGQMVYRPMRNIRVTQRNARLVEVSLGDGQTVRCTPEHRFFLKDGSQVEAQHLQPGMSLESVYRYKANQKGYLRLTNGKHLPLEHHVPFENGVPDGYHAHHKNGIKWDNRPENIELMVANEHNSMHMRGDLNPMRRFPERNHFLTTDFSGGNNGRYRNDLNTQTMIQLREGGASYRTIASQLGCSPYTVRKRVTEANHRVECVRFLDYNEDVYCGSVDEFSRFFVATGDNDGVLVHNCGEQPLPPEGACLLGSVNLTKFVIDPFTDKARFDWERYRKVVAIFTRMLDNVVEINGLPLENQRKEITSKRRHGMGYLGLGSTLTMLGMPYGKVDSVGFTTQVTKELALVGWQQALQLAKEKGPAPIMTEEFAVTPKMLRQRPEMVKDGYEVGDKIPGRILHAKYSEYMKRIAKANPELVAELAEVGARFTHHSSIAPTGTISLSLGNNASNGIEPSFSHRYYRNIIQSGKKTKEQVEVVSFELLAYRHFVKPDATEEDLPDYFVVSDDITPEEHVSIQSASQYWIDSSISKTVNVPTDFAFERFENLYLDAYERGLKGATTFRFNPTAFQGVLVREDDLKDTSYIFTLENGEKVELAGNEKVIYEGEEHVVANLYDALKEGTYGKW